MSNVTVAISTDFLTALNVLPKQQKNKVISFVTKFRNNPTAPGINFEKINNSDPNIYSVRIDQAYRAIVFKEAQSNIFLLLWVDLHDDAYKWAASKRCRINSVTGSLQVFNVEHVEVTAPVSTDTISKASFKPLFASVNDEQLIQMGVPKEQFGIVRAIQTEAALYNKKSWFSADAYEALEYVVNGFTPEEIINSLIEKTEPPKKTEITVSAALNNIQSKRSFVVIDDEEELMRIMNAPLEKWRVFLHPTQQKIVQRKFNGPAQVLGGAGTGKTVVAMHRAKWLAKQLKDNEQILFTTFTVNLARDINDNLNKICSVEEHKKIQVVNFNSWVNTYLKSKKYDYEIVYDDILDKIWEDAINSVTTTNEFAVNFYKDEWSSVVCSQEAFTKEKYLHAARIGRGIRLDRKKRLDIWKVFEEYRSLLNEKKLRDTELAMYECGALVDDTVFAHIIVDEGQDLSPEAFRLIRKLAGPEHVDDIFIAGDTHQRIYKYKTVLSKCGINIRGRSCKLKINYRATEEIRKYAFGVLAGIKFDDMDEAYDDGRICESLTHGNKPTIKCFKTQKEELEFIADTIRSLNIACTPLKDICIVARTKKIVNEYEQRLKDCGVKFYRLHGSKLDDRSRDGVRLATMHRVKGLEFEYVFLVSANNSVLPLKEAMNGLMDETSMEEALTAEKCLIYVALTRARKESFVTAYGKMTSLIK